MIINIPEIVGKLITREKYKFADKDLIADVVKEVAKLVHKQRGEQK